MKAFEIIDLIFKEDLRNDSCGVVHGTTICDGEWANYFGFHYCTMEPDEKSDYFYKYDELTKKNTLWPLPDIILYYNYGNECISLWKIEN